MGILESYVPLLRGFMVSVANELMRGWSDVDLMSEAI